MTMLKKIILGLVLAFGVVAIMLITLLPKDTKSEKQSLSVNSENQSNNYTRCKLQSDKPKIDGNQLRNIASENNTAIANFVGHLMFSFNNGGDISYSYLPLKLLSINQTGRFCKDQKAILTLLTDCADIKLTHRHEFNENFVRFHVNLENISYDHNHLASCNLDLMISVERDGRHRTKEQAWLCYNDEKIVATFAMDQFEFEIDGDPEKIKKGEFSKKRDWA